MDWSKAKRSSISAGSFKPYYDNGAPYHQQFQQFQSPSSSPIIAPQLQQQLPSRSAYYETHWPLFNCDWSKNNHNSNELIALSTYREDSINKIEVIEGSPSTVEHINGTTSEGLDFYKNCEHNVDLPITKLLWDPSGIERLIITNDRLTLLNYDYLNQKLDEKISLVNGSLNSQKNRSYPPLTSFDWNKVSPNLILTSSIDTTCTVWDLNHVQSPHTQLIAHDSEVFDVQFLSNSKDIFASVGCDGSMRVFDLRCLDHSTIIYEPQVPISVTASTSSTSGASEINNTPLLRLATSNSDSYIIATFASKSQDIQIMDMRFPGLPILTLRGHSSNLNSIKWHPTQSVLLSAGDDCQAMIWDISKPSAKSLDADKQNYKNNIVVDHPDFAYNENLEINQATWSKNGDWIGVVSGKGFQGVKV